MANTPSTTRPNELADGVDVDDARAHAPTRPIAVRRRRGSAWRAVAQDLLTTGRRRPPHDGSMPAREAARPAVPAAPALPGPARPAALPAFVLEPAMPDLVAGEALPPASDALAIAVPHMDATAEESLLRHWLGGKNPHTVLAYRKDLADFCAFLRRADGSPLVPQVEIRPRAESVAAAQIALSALVTLGNTRGAGMANALVLAYRTHLLEKATAPRTINRRLAAIRSALKVARMLGAITWTVEVEYARVASVRDMRGPGKDAVGAMMAALAQRLQDAQDGDELAVALALRNLAVLRLLYDLGLRRGEVSSLDLEHWEAARRRLWVWGKKRAEREPIDEVPAQTARALDAWIIEARGAHDGPLFHLLDYRSRGKRLSGQAIWLMVTTLAADLGLSARPHGVRHTAITEALNVSDGDVRAAQRFSRHASLATLQAYDDNRQNLGAKLAAKIAAGMPALGGEESEEGSESA